MTAPYTVFEDLAKEVDVPEDGILSRPIFSDDNVRVVLFGMSAGQEMTEHTTSMEAILHFVRGSAELTLGEESQTVGANAWIHMTPRLPHSVRATESMVFLLILLKKTAESSGGE